MSPCVSSSLSGHLCDYPDHPLHSLCVVGVGGEDKGLLEGPHDGVQVKINGEGWLCAWLCWPVYEIKIVHSLNMHKYVNINQYLNISKFTKGGMNCLGCVSWSNSLLALITLRTPFLLTSSRWSDSMEMTKFSECAQKLLSCRTFWAMSLSSSTNLLDRWTR